MKHWARVITVIAALCASAMAADLPPERGVVLDLCRGWEKAGGPAAQLIRQRQRPNSRREGNRRRISLHEDSALWDAGIRKSPRLIHAQHFERINATSPKLRETKQQAERKSGAYLL